MYLLYLHYTVIYFVLYKLLPVITIIDFINLQTLDLNIIYGNMT